MPTVLTLLADGFEEIEAVAPIDLLRRAGAEVVVAALGEGIHVTGRSGLTIHADTLLTTVESRRFDCVFLPGAPGYENLRADPASTPHRSAPPQRQPLAGGHLCGTDRAPTMPGCSTGRRYTAHFSVAGELPDILASECVVADGHILTSRGAGTAVEFGLLLIEKLFSPEKSREIATSIGA